MEIRLRDGEAMLGETVYLCEKPAVYEESRLLRRVSLLSASDEQVVLQSPDEETITIPRELAEMVLAKTKMMALWNGLCIMEEILQELARHTSRTLLEIAEEDKRFSGIPRGRSRSGSTDL